jgi:hypothetical protein
MADSDLGQAWEYSITHSDRLSNTSGVPQIASIWRQRYADGTTDWDHITRMGREGWEMISAFPVTANGSTLYVTFIFRRPAGRAVPPAPPTPAQAQAEPNAPPTEAEPPIAPADPGD